MIESESQDPKSNSVANKDFYPIILQKKDSFCVYLPEWKISGEGSSLEEAFQEYELNRNAFESRSAKYGLATVTPDPYPTLKRAAILRDLGLFSVKVASSACAVILVTVLLLPNIGAALRQQARALVPAEFLAYKFWAIELPSRINERLDRLEPEEQARMLTEWNKFFDRTSFLWKQSKCQ